MSVDALVDFDRRIHLRHGGADRFILWLTAQGWESPKVGYTGKMLKLLLDDRHTICSEPIRIARDGREVVIHFEGSEWGRMSAESLRDLVLRAVRVKRD